MLQKKNKCLHREIVWNRINKKIELKKQIFLYNEH